MIFGKKTKPVLFISYFYGTKGCCPAEWADDKVHALSSTDKEIILLTSIFSAELNEENTKHFRVPSLSLADLNHEVVELKNEGRKIPFIKLFLLFPVVITIGLALDLLQKLITSGNGGGKWSWAFPASICALYLALRYRCNLVFTTGGPASSHLAGAFVKVFSGKQLICELQDPLTGKDIGRNSRSARMLGWVERIIVKTADKVVYVTKSAAAYAKSKYPNAKADIVAIYPGSRRFNSPHVRLNYNESEKLKELTLIHLGTLYSSRNLNTIIEAIDALIEGGLIQEGQIKIHNLGEMYGEIKGHHLAKSYVTQEGIIPRSDAIQRARTHMVSLLVQHSDGRSNATIPYKTYDYFNIGNPIFGLTNSDELFSLLESNGHLPVQVSDVDMIKKTLIDLLNNYMVYKKRISAYAIDINAQTAEILS